MKKYICIIGIALTCFTVSIVNAENDTINERLIRVEESVKSLDIRINDTNKRIDELRQDMNRRFEESNQNINRRFEESNQNINRRFEDIRSLMYVILTSLFSILAMICFLIVYLVKKEKKETIKQEPRLKYAGL